MRNYYIGFPTIIISLIVVFSGLINFTYGQVNQTSTYENKTEGIRFQYPAHWGNLSSFGGCINNLCPIQQDSNSTSPPASTLMIMKLYNNTEGFACNCNNLTDFMEMMYGKVSSENGFTFINDNKTTIGKKYPAWQFEYSSLNSNDLGTYPATKLIVSTKVNDTFYAILYNPIIEGSRVKHLPELRELLDSMEFFSPQIPVKVTKVTKTPSFMNTIFEEKLPPTTVGDRQASLYTKINPTILTPDKKQNPLFQLRLVDNNTGNNITNVNYFLTISKEGDELMNELFYSKDGPLTLKFQPNQGPITVYGTTEPFLGGWMNENGQITVSGPVLTEGGQYNYAVEIFGVDNVRNIFVPENAPRFDSSFFINMNGTDQTMPSSMLETSPVSPNGLQILSHNSFTDSIGYLHVVGEVQNNGATNAQFVQVTGTFYDSNNQVVGTQFTYTNPSDIGVGQKAPFDLTLLSASIPVSQIDHYNLVASSQ